MRLLDFFKRKKIQEPVPEKISFKEIQEWLDSKTKENKEKEEKIFDLIKGKIKLFVKEVGEKTKILKEVDIESKKVEDRAKIIVRQSLDKYLGYVDIFIRDLDKSEKQNLEQFIKDANKTFSDFDKHSYIFYQRATFLIGEEIVAVKQEINNLSKYFTKLFNENEKTINSSRKISSVKSKLNQLDETDAVLEKINLEIKFSDEKIKDRKEKEKKVLCEIKEIKESEDYAKNLKKKEEIKSTEKQLEEDVLKLKSLVDFKALSNAFHSDEIKMEIIKSYKQDFQRSILKDRGDSILSLIREAELDSNIIADKIKQINKKKQKIDESKKHIKKDETKILSEEIQKTKSEIENLEIEKVKQLKRGREMKEMKLKIMEMIKQGVVGLGGKLSEE